MGNSISPLLHPVASLEAASLRIRSIRSTSASLHTGWNGPTASLWRAGLTFPLADRNNQRLTESIYLIFTKFYIFLVQYSFTNIYRFFVHHAGAKHAISSLANLCALLLTMVLCFHFLCGIHNWLCIIPYFYLLYNTFFKREPMTNLYMKLFQNVGFIIVIFTIKKIFQILSTSTERCLLLLCQFPNLILLVSIWFD